MLRWGLRIVGGLIALVVLVVAGVFVAYTVWISGHKRALAEGSQIASTPLGEIEYAILGEGEPRLMIHGTPGGYEQVLISPKIRPEAYRGAQVIGVSRPGYLRTPLSSGRTPEEQADLYVALLDELGYDRVVVEAVSGGAPFGLQMAIRHPDRVEALILLVPMLTTMESDGWEDPGDLVWMMQDISLFLFGKRFALNFIPDLDPNDPRQMEFATQVLLTNTPAQPRVPGQKNDVDQFASLDIANWPLEDLEVPTLFLHGDADTNAPYEGSVAASARIPNARLVTFEGAEHSAFITRAERIDNEISRFLEQVRARK